MNNKDEIFKFEPLFEKWNIKEFLGSGSIGKVYKISRVENSKEYISAVKYLSFPTEDIYNSAINSLGNNEEMISNYFKNYIDNIVNEINLLYDLKGHSNIISYEDHQIKRVESENKWNIFIRMEYAISLKEILKDKVLKDKEVLKLGIDICNALEFCHSKNIIHRDIKEANIFISNNNNSYKLGDFSVSKNMSENTSAITKVGTINYMPPEVLKGEKYTKNADIYSLGIVLYKLLNKGKIPFLPENQNNITQSDIEMAISKRISGHELIKPKDMREDIYDVIQKACLYNSEDRYQEISDLKNDLTNCLNSESQLNTTGNKIVDNSNYNNETVDIFKSSKTKGKTEKFKINKFKSLSIGLLVLIATLIVMVMYKNGILYYKKSTHVSTDIKTPSVSNKENLETVKASSTPNLDTISPTETTEIVTESVSKTSTPESVVSETIAKYGTNLVTNSGFESGFSMWIEGTHPSSESEINIVSSTSYSGSKCFEIKKHNLVAYDYYTNEITVKKDNTYLLECYCKMTDVVGDESESLAGTLVAVDYGDGWKFVNEKYTGSKNWTKVSLKIKIPENNSSNILRIKIGMRAATGTSYFDDVSVREIIE